MAEFNVNLGPSYRPGYYDPYYDRPYYGPATQLSAATGKSIWVGLLAGIVVGVLSRIFVFKGQNGKSKT
jgi:hypothetical protein